MNRIKLLGAATGVLPSVLCAVPALATGRRELSVIQTLLAIGVIVMLFVGAALLLWSIVTVNAVYVKRDMFVGCLGVALILIALFAYFALVFS